MDAIPFSAAPCLGETSNPIAALLGAPRRVESHGEGIVRWFVQDGRDLAIVFDRNEAVALHVPYQPSSLQRIDLAGMKAHLAGSSAAHVYVGDTGLIIAAPTCPRTAVELLARLADAAIHFREV